MKKIINIKLRCKSSRQHAFSEAGVLGNYVTDFFSAYKIWVAKFFYLSGLNYYFWLLRIGAAKIVVLDTS
jgi:hypothetical protein